MGHCGTAGPQLLPRQRWEPQALATVVSILPTPRKVMVMAWPIAGEREKVSGRRGHREKGPPGEEPQEQAEGCEAVGVLPGCGRAGKAAGHNDIGVALIRLKPLLETPATVPVLSAGLERVAPELLTQVSRGGEVIRERAARGPCWAAAFPCGG